MTVNRHPSPGFFAGVNHSPISRIAILLCILGFTAGCKKGGDNGPTGPGGPPYTTLVDDVRARAPSARIIVVNVPNLAAFPFLVGASRSQRRAAQRTAVRMSTTVVNTLVAQNIVVVDILCDGRMYQPSNFSGDGYHPSDAGYTFRAGELVRAVTSTTYPAPRSDCGFMYVVPDL
jgi:hypothetical protein